jgi:hypothetical protein
MRISLTSIPPRFGSLRSTIDSLLNQSVQPTQIELYIPKTFGRFGPCSALPKLPSSSILDVHVVEEDLGPLTKIGYALQRHCQDEDIVCCDDDQRYPSDWLERFMIQREQRPDDPLCLSGYFIGTAVSNSRGRARFKGAGYQLKKLMSLGRSKPAAPWTRSGYVDIAEGWAGICVKPSWFGPDFMEIPDEVRYVDDVWISAYLASKGRFPWLIAPGMSWGLGINAEGDGALKTGRFDGLDRDGLNRRAVAYLSERLGVWG